MSDHVTVIPVFNEAPTVGALVARAACQGAVLVVDDGSSDGSADAAAAAGSEAASRSCENARRTIGEMRSRPRRRPNPCAPCTAAAAASAGSAAAARAARRMTRARGSRHQPRQVCAMRSSMNAPIAIA